MPEMETQATSFAYLHIAPGGAACFSRRAALYFKKLINTRNNVLERPYIRL